VVSQLPDPGSEFRVHRQWYLTTAMDALPGTDFAVAEKNRLYRCLDRVLKHKQEPFLWLRQKLAALFKPEFEVLLYDLTSTYFEGAMEENPKAKYGHSWDKRTDCLQLVIALVITTDGFPLAYIKRRICADESCGRLPLFVEKGGLAETGVEAGLFEASDAIHGVGRAVENTCRRKLSCQRRIWLTLRLPASIKGSLSRSRRYRTLDNGRLTKPHARR